MKTSVLKVLPIAATLSLGLGIGGNVYASAYALSYNNVFDFTVTQAPIGSANFIFPNTTVSKDSASLTGFPSAANSDPINAPVINLGNSSRADNVFTPNGNGNAAGTYAYVDNWIKSQQTATPGTSAQSLNIVETRVADAGAGAGTSDNASDTSFSIPFLIAGPTTLTFDFKADPFLNVALDPGTLFPSVARAGLSASITIVNDLTGTTVFSWAPNGTTSGIVGGTVNSAGVDLNTQIARNFAFPGQTIYDPTGCGVQTGVACGASFNAITNELGNGNYTLTLRVAEFAEVERSAVPEPATLALIGLGLAGLGFARRKQA